MNAVTAALDHDPLFTPKTVAARYGLAPQTLSNMRCAGRGPRFVKTPYGIRYRLSDLADWERATFQHGAGGMATPEAHEPFPTNRKADCLCPKQPAGIDRRSNSR